MTTDEVVLGHGTAHNGLVLLVPLHMMWASLILAIACSLLFSYFYNVAWGVFPYPNWVVELAEMEWTDPVAMPLSSWKMPEMDMEPIMPRAHSYTTNGPAMPAFDDFIQGQARDKHKRDLDTAMEIMEDIAKKKAMLTAGPSTYLNVGPPSHYDYLGYCRNCHSTLEHCALRGCKPEPTLIPGAGVIHLG
jgi:hypothetical protein